MNNLKKILVTGDSSGIGKKLTELLLSKDYYVIGVSRKDSNQIIIHKNYTHIKQDLNDIEEFIPKLESLIEELGPLNGFVHCAGFDKLSPLFMNKLSVLKELFNIHVFSPLQIITSLSKKNKLESGSSIVLISSLAAHEGASGHTMYAAAKGALEGFIPSAASELAKNNIRINAVAPGIVETNMSQNFLGKLSLEQVNELEKSYPLGFGKPEYISDLIYFLLSEKSKWITGQKVIIDGGHLSRS